MQPDTYDDARFNELAEAYRQQCLPHLMTLKNRVLAGYLLTEADVTYIYSVARRLEEFRPYLSLHPESEQLVNLVIRVCHDIARLGVVNESEHHYAKAS